MSNAVKENIKEVFLSTKEIANWVSDQMATGKLRKLGPRLYTTNMIDTPEHVVRRNVWELVSLYCPGALITDRTGIENKPATDGSVFVVSDRSKKVVLPGLTIAPRKAEGPSTYDRRFLNNLFLATRGRALLENMRPSRAKKGVSRTLSRSEIEDFLDREVSLGGEDAINTLRDEARAVSKILNMANEMAELDRLIGTILGSRDDATITSPPALARISGEPYDRSRVNLFEMLRSELSTRPPVLLSSAELNANGIANLAFFESYFSNFIEGTEFEIDEAIDIVFNNIIPNERPGDAHDILGTFQVASNLMEMKKTPNDVDGFIQLLKYRHAVIMSGRPEKLPGNFKRTANRAGSTQFVSPELVTGTLKRGFEFYQTLSDPFARATFMMFLVSEVHPFADGNGRTARIMMNADLISAGQQRIIIPIVYRNNYLAALKTLSQETSAEPLIAVLSFAQKYTSMIPWMDRHSAHKSMEDTHAFVDPRDADDQGVRLILPAT